MVADTPETSQSVAPPAGRLRLLSLLAFGALVLAVISLGLNGARTAPYLWPAGSGVLIDGDAHFTGTWGPGARILPRPPTPGPPHTRVLAVAPDSPAADHGVQRGDTVVRRLDADGTSLALDEIPDATSLVGLARWRLAYQSGLSSQLTLRTSRPGASATGDIVIQPRPVWSSPLSVVAEWTRRYGGGLLQMVVFVACAVVLLAVRGDVTSRLAALALTLCAVSASGPLLGAERALPWPLAPVLTFFSWNVAPMTFPCVALSLAYFPRPSPHLRTHPWLHAVPFVIVLPMFVMSASTALFLSGATSFASLAAFDARHPEVSYGSFFAALALNVMAMVEGVMRYRHRSDANERRRIRVALYTTVLGILAFAGKEGASALLAIVTPGTTLPAGVAALLDLLVVLPALGVTYAVTVHRVLGPRWFLRRSLQYALAERTLTWLPALAALPLLVSVYLQRHRTLAEIASGSPALYMTLLLATLAAFQMRTRIRTWLDQRFFRTEYDAQRLLASLAGQLRFETDPSDLATLLVEQLDQAFHPTSVALLVGGIEADVFVPVAVRRGSVESLPVESRLVSLLQWSDKPLDVSLGDARSPVQRLPEEDREWLACANASLLIPVLAQDRTLMGLLLLGDKQSEELYDREDEGLLSSVAAQVGLFLDVARLRDRAAASNSDTARALEVAGGAEVSVLVCPRCGRCAEPGDSSCPSDGSPLERVWGVAPVIEGRYRVEHRLGRGGMGEVFRAHDERLERDVAVKIVRADRHLPASAVGRFRREAQIVARLRHPSIVAVYDFGTTSTGTAFLVMELLRGHDLRHHLRAHGRLGLGHALRVLTAISSAIHAAHEEGVLHRDLKPENVLLTEDAGEVKVLDFGIAKLLEDDEPSAETALQVTATQAGAILGTPAYMSPEQLRGEPLDARTDVFSLGVIAYELLSGELPFGSTSVADIAVRQREPVPSLTHVGVSSTVDAAVHAALAFDRQKRPTNAAAFAQSLV